jgi:hypothetical protein
MKKHLESRRQFVKAAGLAAGALLLPCAGMASQATGSPEKSGAANTTPSESGAAD